MLSRSKIFLYLCLFFIVGIAAAPYLKLTFFIKLLFILGASIFIFICWRNRKVVVLSSCFIFFILGLARYDFSIHKITSDDLSFYNNKDEILFEGKVFSEPDVRTDKTRLSVQGEYFYKLSKIEKQEIKKELGKDILYDYLQDLPKQKIKGQALLVSPRHPEYQYGEKILVFGKLLKPGVEEDSKFSYQDYLARYNIYSISYYPKILKISKKIDLKSFIFKIKDHFEEKINQTLPEPHASFLGGLLFGSRRAIPQDLLNKFNITGVSHIVAVSGYNITIIAGVLSSILLRKFSRKKSFWLSVLAIFLFTILTGATGSVVRAAIMGILVLVARNSGRLSNIANSLAFTAGAMLLANPKIFAIDLGFQLSFLSTLGIVYFMPYIEKILKWLPEYFSVRESAAMTLSAQVLVVPKILLSFSKISLVAPIVNVLILPVIPVIMFLGFITGLLGQVSIFLAKIIGFFTYSFLNYEIAVIDFFSKIPYASMQFEKVGKWIVWGYLAVVLIVYGWVRWKEMKTTKS